MAIFRVHNRDLAKQLVRDRGFIISHEDHRDCHPYVATLAGDPKKLSKRQMPYIHIVGRLRDKKEMNYVPSKEN